MKSRLFITGDTHSRFTKFSFSNFPIGRSLSKNDIVFIAGDFGGIWAQQESNEEKYWLNWLNDRPWTTVIVLGNHENYVAIENNYPKTTVNIGNSDNIIIGRPIRDSVIIVDRGTTFTIDGKIFFTYGGAYSIDKIYRNEKSWWKEEQGTKEEELAALETLKGLNNEVDIIITHELPLSFKRLLYGNSLRLYDEDRTSAFLEGIYRIIKYKKWYGGHLHDDLLNYMDNISLVYRNIFEIKEEDLTNE